MVPSLVTTIVPLGFRANGLLGPGVFHTQPEAAGLGDGASFVGDEVGLREGRGDGADFVGLGDGLAAAFVGDGVGTALATAIPLEAAKRVRAVRIVN